MPLMRFGPFELETERQELRRNGMLIKLAPQPMQLLTLLVARPGEILPRDDLRRQIWGDHPTADLDKNLNVCIAQVRSALSDDAETPKWLQTVPRKGYRFLGQIDQPLPEAVAQEPEVSRSWSWTWIAAAAVGVLILLGSAAFGIARWRVESSSPELLAVLPFASIPESAADPTVDLLRHGLLDETTTLLGSQSDSLGVIARTSVAALPTKATIADIRSRLGAVYILEGAVRQEPSGAGMRVTARLARTSNGQQLWAGSFDQNGRSSAEFERETAGEIATAVLRVLRPGKLAAAMRTGAGCDGAGWEALRNARFLQLERKLTKSSEQYVEAAKDPHCKEALAGLAEVQMLRARGGRQMLWPEVQKAADAAIAALPDDPQAVNTRANVSFWFEWNWARAESEYRRALQLNPNYAPARHDYAWFLVAQGRPSEGVESLRHAIRLDPISARINIDAGWLLLQAERFEEAVRQTRRTMEIDEANHEAESCLKRAQFYLGDKSKLPSEMTEFEQRSAWYGAVWLANSGNLEAAIEKLEEAFRSHQASMVLLRSEPAFRPLRNDPRFKSLAERMNLRY
jgi:DNA-binding winged helix-turn-helix (wHTH) protein/TolB-like protein/Tfp pilus assembly protein PilF